VPHEQIMPADALPTFNSTAIEACVQNIPGLSEYFLLFNDDTFIGKPLSPQFWFDEIKGKIKALVYFNKNKKLIRKAKTEIYANTILSANKTIRKMFGKQNNIKWSQCHGIDPYIKSDIIKALENSDIKEWLIKTQHSRFRTKDDLQRWFFNLWSVFGSKNSILIYNKKLKNRKHFIYNFINRNKFQNPTVYSANSLRVKRSIANGATPAVFCINDIAKNTDGIRAENLKFLTEYFPNKSPFEL
jgi:hypothetical protein